MPCVPRASSGECVSCIWGRAGAAGARSSSWEAHAGAAVLQQQHSLCSHWGIVPCVWQCHAATVTFTSTIPRSCSPHPASSPAAVAAPVAACNCCAVAATVARVCVCFRLASAALLLQVLPEEAAPCEEGQRPDHRSQRGARFGLVCAVGRGAEMQDGVLGCIAAWGPGVLGGGCPLGVWGWLFVAACQVQW